MVVNLVISDVTQLVMTDVTIVKQAITPVRDIPAQTVTATAMTITQQKIKSPAVMLRLGVIPESQGLHKCFARSHPKPLNLISFYAEYRLLFFAITFTVFALMLGISHIEKGVSQLYYLECFFKGFIPPPFILAFFRKVLAATSVTFHCLVIFTILAVIGQFCR